MVAQNDKEHFHAANRRRWEIGAKRWGDRADRHGLCRRCSNEPGLVLSAAELAALGDVMDKSVCVLGSGDNQVVFALAGLGARVTSVDVAQNQLDIAKGRAESLGFDVAFVRADVTDLSVFERAQFDVVYTGGHVAVWVADLRAYYSEAARILRGGGLFLINEYHPFRRIWGESEADMVVRSRYLDRGPFAYDVDEDILEPASGRLKSYEFNWTIGDLLNAVIGAGCRIEYVDEFGEQVGDWESGPMHGLPECFLIAARKRAE